jgi:ERF superfamily
MEKVIAGGLTGESVAVMERLVALDREMRKDHAEREFNQAFNALQAEMPIVKAIKPVEGKDKNTGAAFIKYHFAPYEDIMEQVRPLLLKHAFSVSFSMDFKEGRVIQHCTLSHAGGHSRTNTFMARVGGGPPGSSEAQGDGAAATFAKRYALCSAINIVCERDTDGLDARKEGAPITEDQAMCLRDLVKQTKSNEAAFLKYAGAATYEEIGSARYDQLFQSLNRKLAGL